jgi:hypothetical protein
MCFGILKVLSPAERENSIPNEKFQLVRLSFQPLIFSPSEQAEK